MIGLTGLPAASAADTGQATISTVRLDSRSGRLVRVVSVTPRPVPSRQVRPHVVASRLAGPVPAPAAPSSIDLNSLIAAAATRHEVDPLLIHSVVRVESNYNPFAVSPKGAEGLMQLIPNTARRFGASDSFDVRQNIEAGVRYLKYLQDMFGDDRLALAAYNAGEAAVLKYKDIPPYQETEQYVTKVGKAYGEARRRTRPKAAVPAPAPQQTESQPAAEPLRGLEVSTDDAGRYVLRTR